MNLDPTMRAIVRYRPGHSGTENKQTGTENKQSPKAPLECLGRVTSKNEKGTKAVEESPRKEQ